MTNLLFSSSSFLIKYHTLSSLPYKLVVLFVLVLVQNFAARGLALAKSNESPSSVWYTEKIHKKQENSCRSIIKHKDLAFSFLTICSSRPIEQYFYYQIPSSFPSITDQTLSSLCLTLISAIAYIYSL